MCSSIIIVIIIIFLYICRSTYMAKSFMSRVKAQSEAEESDKNEGL